jgi:two-component system sensor histidine kinase VicK
MQTGSSHKDIYALREELVNIHFVFSLNEGRFKRVDPSLKSIIGTELKGTEDVTKLLSKIDPPDLVNLKKAFVSIQKNEPVGILHFHVQINGKVKFLVLSPVLIKIDDEKVLAGTIADHTPEMLNINEIRKFANKKNSILTLLAHDLRGPLSISNEVLNTMIHSEQNENKTLLSDISIQKRISNVRTTIGQCINIISDLVHREYLEAVETDLVYRSVDVALRLDEYMEEARKSDDAAQRSFSFRASHDHIVMGLDEAKFMQVINNLLSNALKFTREGGKISLEIEEEENTVLFVFADDGIGIPKELQPHLFKKFTEARRSGLRGEPTLGLGLYLVHTIIEWHKGAIWVESEEGKGTTFYFRLPKLLSVN